MQQKNASIAARLGGQLAALNAETKDLPPDIRPQRLPPGINRGIARLATMYTKVSEKDDGQTPKGEVFFRASAIVLGIPQRDGTISEYLNGEKISAGVTQQIVPLCNIPAKVRDGKEVKEAVPVKDNFNRWRSILQALGMPPCPHTPADDPTSEKTEAYFFKYMAALTADPQKHPIYISFSTRGWTPPATVQQPHPQEMVFEEWHGLASPEVVAMLQAKRSPSPPGAVSYNPARVQPEPFSEPPQDNPPGDDGQDSPLRNGPTTQNTQTTRTTIAQGGQVSSSEDTEAEMLTPGDANEDIEPPDEEEIAELVETANADPDGESEEGSEAIERLEDLAWAAGWTKKDTDAADDWAKVGQMALQGPEVVKEGVPAIGSHWLFAKRDTAGNKLLTRSGKELPAFEVEVTAVEQAAQSAFVKAVKDGKDVIDMRTRQPLAVKWEWLEPLP
jgi:hypothetical protein